MEDDGWVHATTVAQRGRPDKKIYTVSKKGRAELARWIAEPLAEPLGQRAQRYPNPRHRRQAAWRRVRRRGGAARPDRGAARGMCRLVDTFADSRNASSLIRQRCVVQRYTTTSCCAAGSEPKKAPSAGSAKWPPR
jgi:hypothetical protein